MNSSYLSVFVFIIVTIIYYTVLKPKLTYEKLKSANMDEMIITNKLLHLSLSHMTGSDEQDAVLLLAHIGITTTTTTTTTTTNITVINATTTRLKTV